MDATLSSLEARQVRSRPSLRLRRAASHVVWLQSPLLAALGLPHAFSTRLGGVSQGRFASLTLGSPPHHRETPEHLAENWRRLQDAAGCPGKVLQVHQVHGREVAKVVAGQPWDPHCQADAIVSTDPTHPIAVRVADCCPVLLASDDGRVVAAVHAGWRGVIAGVIEATLGKMAVDPKRVVAAIGPCIGFEAFEVGPEVLAAFRGRFGEAAPLREGLAGGKGHVDLAASVELALREAGVDRIDTAGRCTFADETHFFSHRRDRGTTGRMAAMIKPRPD